jgi:DNA replication protein DnaC
MSRPKPIKEMVRQLEKDMAEKAEQWEKAIIPWRSAFKCEKQCAPHPFYLPTALVVPGNVGMFSCPLRNADCWAEQSQREKVATEMQNAERAAETVKRERTSALILAAGIPKRYAVADLDHAEKTPALAAAWKWLEHGGVTEGRALLILGPVGTGKTFAAAAIMRDIIQRTADDATPPSCVFASAPNLVNRIRFADYADRLEAMETVTHAGILVLDDLSLEADTDTTRGILDEIIYEREGNLRPTIITANKRPESFKDIFGERIADRLLSPWATVYVITGPSLRGRKEGTHE